MSGSEPHAILEVTGEKCPMNYVRTKLRLEELSEGEILAVTVSEGKASRNVPRSAAEDGHEVLSIQSAGDAKVRVLIRKREVEGGA